MSIESRIKRIEDKLRIGKEFKVIPRVIIKLCDGNTNNTEEGIVVIGGYAKKRGNNEQETIETA